MYMDQVLAVLKGDYGTGRARNVVFPVTKQECLNRLNINILVDWIFPKRVHWSLFQHGDGLQNWGDQPSIAVWSISSLVQYGRTRREAVIPL